MNNNDQPMPVCRPGKLQVYGTKSMPFGIPLKHAVLVAARNLEDAAKALRVTPYFLRLHRLQDIPVTDAERAMVMPGQRIMAMEAT